MKNLFKIHGLNLGVSIFYPKKLQKRMQKIIHIFLFSKASLVININGGSLGWVLY